MLTGMQQSADVVVAARKTTYFHLVDPKLTSGPVRYRAVQENIGSP
jgi:hypothetical protein